MASRKGMELSINFVVMLILGMVFLAGSIFLLEKVVCGGVEMQCQVTQNLRAEMEEAFSRGDAIALPLTRKRIETGGLSFSLCGENDCDEGAWIAFGVRNIHPQREKFTYTITYAGSHPPGADDGFTPQDWIITKQDPEELDFNDRLERIVLFAIPSEIRSGSFTYTLSVCYRSTAGGNQGECPSGYELYDLPKSFTLILE